MATTGLLAQTPLAERAPVRGALFSLVEAGASGIDFRYVWDPPEKYDHELVNGVTGGGVCLGDVDGDGLEDLFLTQPFKGNKLYRNLGDFHFEDITEKAGLTKEGALWGTGASFGDVDNDGDLDLFVCGYDCPDRLYLNQGKGTFVEGAAQAGLSHVGASVMVAFADYDRDGDLDAYLCTNHIDPKEEPLWEYLKDASGHPIVPDALQGVAKPLYRPDIRDGKLVPAGEPDRLYRNNGDGTFEEVAKISGLYDEDFGLSATWWDYNNDGFPDLYVANDFYDPDHLYRNNGDGTFTDVAKYALPHTPWFSMGSDVADLNNDGWLDFMASDMQGSTHYKQKLSMGDMQGWFLETAVPRQYMRNALYINTGELRFQEAAQMAGLASTDWTWSLKFADFDSDGLTDLYVTNGAERYWDHSDLMGAARGEQRVNTPELKKIWLNTPPRNDPNRAFRNRGELIFEDVSAAWGLGAEQVSYGAAVGDLDGDGDLDIVVNNFNAAPSLYRNNESSNRLAVIALRGVKSNRDGLGAMLRVTTSSGRQTHYLTLTRGYMSANAPSVSLGLGQNTRFDLEIDWPSGVRQAVKGLVSGRRYVITETPAGTAPSKETASLFVLSPALKDVIPRERPFDDFAREPLLPNKLSQLGPGMAWGDVDGDGDDDLYLGGPAGQAGQVYLTGVGQFARAEATAFDRDLACEDMGAVFLDADSDGDLDLYVASGGVEAPLGSPLYRDRLYLNDGKGTFTSAGSDVLPDLRDSSGVVAAADVDRDGDVDLFVGSRIIPGQYPRSSSSRFLRNHSGRFVDETSAFAPALATAGMVTGALWGDVDGDAWLDLLLVAEWGTLRVLKNDRGNALAEMASSVLIDMKGWWNGITGGDVDHDGDIDYVLTNTGLNSKYHASPEHPARIYYGDMDGSGKAQLIEAKNDEGSWLPVRGKSCSQRAMPVLKQRFPTFEKFASASLSDIYTPTVLAEAEIFDATQLSSVLLLNEKGAGFAVKPLPRAAQISPGFGCSLTDVNADGHLDLVIAQNAFSPQSETGRLDGGVGAVLLGDGTGDFVNLMARESGILIPGDAKSLAVVDLNQDSHADVVVATNDGPTLAFINRAQHQGSPLSFRLRAKGGNVTAIGTRATLHCEGAEPQMAELYAGSGYLSQSPGILFFSVPKGATPTRLEVRWPDGQPSVLDLARLKSRRLQINQPE